MVRTGLNGSKLLGHYCLRPLGISFTCSQEKQTLSGVVCDKPDDLVDECGDQTFVPYMVHVRLSRKPA